LEKQKINNSGVRDMGKEKSVVCFLLVPAIVFSFGCAARQTVKQTAVAVPEAQATTVETPVAAAVPTAVPVQKYVVKKGDTLWGISGKNSIYGDNFEWPLLFRANRDMIEDPDIIEIAQELTVKKDYSNDEKTDAKKKAYDTPPFKKHKEPRKVLPLKY
jgi:hypothetical protein